MQERAFQEVAEGNVAGAVERLRRWAHGCWPGANPSWRGWRSARPRAWKRPTSSSEDAKKQLKYGTRALLASPGGTGNYR